MNTYSTREAAKKLSISAFALGKYLKTGKVQAPAHTVKTGPRRIYLWTDAEIEHVRKLLPKIANGRKTRYQKLRDAQKTQPGAAVPQSSRKRKKK